MTDNTKEDLTRIKGVGAATAKKLIAAGIASFADLAALNAGEEPLVSIAQSQDQAAGWIAAAAGMAPAPADPEGKPLSSDETPEAQLQNGARLPADGRAGDRQTPSTNTGAATVPVSSASAHDQAGAVVAAAPAAPSADWASQIETDSELADFCPHLTEALRTWSESSSELPKSLVITSKREGFRRAGIAHPRAETEHEFDRFDFDDIEQMLAEPVLTVRLA